jgi:hypothetical protein
MPKFHALADAFPLIEGSDFDELVKDIEANGLLQPIIMFEGQILDGRNRWLACQKLGIPHTEIKFRGDDPVSFVWSTNAVRRQLTASQKSVAAAKLATASSGRPQRTGPGGPIFGDELTNTEVAKKTGVSESSIKRAKRVLALGLPSVVTAVEDGKLAVTAAERLAQKPQAEQAHIMATVPVADIPSVVPDPRWDHNLRSPDDEPKAPAKTIKPKGVGRGHVAPKFQMTEQLKRSSAAGEKSRVKFWTEHKDQIKDLDPELLVTFVADMEANRRYISQLLNLIKNETENNGS